MMQTRTFLYRMFIFSLIFALAACSPAPAPVPPNPTLMPSAAPVRTATPTRTSTVRPSLTPTRSTLFLPLVNLIPTQKPVIISLPVAMQGAAPTQTPVWIPVTGSTISVPILVYQHVTDAGPDSRYKVKVSAFREQMQALYDRGYTAVTISTLAGTLREGKPLPPKPVVITFDDGNLDIYQNAFTILRSFNFPGVFYVVSSYLKGDGYVSARQLKEMIAAGWEVGSHSMTHADLVSDTPNADWEIGQSRANLQEAMGAPIDSFAYPFGMANESIFNKVYAFGYTSAVCSGSSNRQSLDQIYCLPRREVKNTTTVEALLKMIEEP